mgnify:CR=1 FL=1|tara:strand:+ start:148 stop:477 length:330 start_codon:yes stop_codon:yes gene_type:complete
MAYSKAEVVVIFENNVPEKYNNFTRMFEVFVEGQTSVTNLVVSGNEIRFELDSLKELNLIFQVNKALDFFKGIDEVVEELQTTGWTELPEADHHLIGETDFEKHEVGSL